MNVNKNALQAAGTDCKADTFGCGSKRTYKFSMPHPNKDYNFKILTI